jgi:predicted ester cyclase
MANPEEAKEVIRRWNEEGWSGGKYDLAYEIIAPVMTVHGAGGQAVGMGPDGLIDLIKTWRTAFPDGNMAIDDIIVEGDLVAIRNTWHGTQKESFYGIPPSGKWVDVTSIGIDRVVNGQVIEGWGELDMVGMMQSLGAFPMVGIGAVKAGKSPLWGPSSTVIGDSKTSPEENKKILLRFIDAISRGDRLTVEETVNVSRYLEHNPVWGADNLSSGVDVYSQLRQALTDLHFEVEEAIMVAEGSQVAAHSIVTGTHTGSELFGVAPSGKQLKWTHSDFVRLVDGKIVERWVSADTLTFIQQLGAVPSAGG